MPFTNTHLGIQSLSLPIRSEVYNLLFDSVQKFSLLHIFMQVGMLRTSDSIT